MGQNMLLIISLYNLTLPVLQPEKKTFILLSLIAIYLVWFFLPLEHLHSHYIQTNRSQVSYFLSKKKNRQIITC